MPIHDLYLRVVVKDDKNRITNKIFTKVASDFKDPFAASCKMPAL